MFGLIDIPKMVGAAAIASALTYAIVAPSRYAAGYSAGKSAIVAAVTKQNAEAAQAARLAKSLVDQCEDAGGTWDQTTGRCAR